MVREKKNEFSWLIWHANEKWYDSFNQPKFNALQMNPSQNCFTLEAFLHLAAYTSGFYLHLYGHSFDIMQIMFGLTHTVVSKTHMLIHREQKPIPTGKINGISNYTLQHPKLSKINRRVAHNMLGEKNMFLFVLVWESSVLGV